MDRFLTLVNALNVNDVRYVVIGVWAANYYAHREALQDLLDREARESS